MKKIYIILVVIVIAAVAGVWYFSSSGNRQSPVNETVKLMNDNQAIDNEAADLPPIINEGENTVNKVNNLADNDGGLAVNNQFREFNLTAANFKYDVTEIRVKKGETIKINFKVVQGFHDLVIDEFNARTAQLQTGQSEIIEFVADQSGEFEYYCSIGSHRAMGMVGKLIVE